MTLITILMVPLVVLGVVAFALIIAFGYQVSRVTAELDAKKQQESTAPPPAEDEAAAADGSGAAEPVPEAPIAPEESPAPAPEAGASAGCADASPPAGEEGAGPDLPRDR